MGIILSVLRKPSRSSKPSILRTKSNPIKPVVISHPYALQPHSYSHDTQSRHDNNSSCHDSSNRNRLSMHNRSFKSINIKRSLSISHKQFKIDSNVEEEEDGFRRLLSLSPNPDSTFRDGDKQHPEKTTAKQVLRKVHKVEGDWDLVRQGDLDGYKHSVNVIRNPDTV